MPDLSVSDHRPDYNPLPTFLDGVPTIRALAKLDMSNNAIPYDQQANLKGICTSESIDLAL